MRKTTIAKEALRQLDFIRDILVETNWSGSAAQFHSHSANNYIRSVLAGGMGLPEWLNRNPGYLRAHGWRW